MTPASTAPQCTHQPALGLVPWVWLFIYACARVALAFRFRIRVALAGPAPRGPVLLACKHVSAWDIPISAYVTSHFLGRKAYFQMGSFIGYPVFGRIVPVLKACGGFSVLRPKEVLRLRKREDHDRARLHELMDEVNGTAEATRQAVLAQGGVLVVFPEGTRDAEAVRPVRSMHEIGSALAVARGSDPAARPVILPATLSYGRKRLFRRRLDVDVGHPIELGDATAQEVATLIEGALRERWRAAPG